MIREYITAERRRTAAKILTLAGTAALVLMLVGSAATAPPALSDEGSPAQSRTLVGAMGAGADGGVYVLDGNGSVVWSYQENAISYNSVARTPDGDILASFQNESMQCGQYESPCVRTGVRIIDQDTRTVEWSYHCAAPYARNHEVHDSELLPDGDVLLADMGAERIVIVNRSTKTIEWQWRASEHYATPSNPQRTDWLHINDVDHIGDGRYLVSVRNANQLLLVERGKGVVEVINKDVTDANDDDCRGAKNNQMSGADPKCGDPEVLDHQHNPQWLGAGAVLVADSENDRVVELHRKDGVWQPAWTQYRANGLRFDWPRDADRLANGNTLIQDTRNNRIVEVDQSGNVVWAAQAPEQTYDADRGGSEYPAGPAYNTSGESAPLTQPLDVVSVAYGALRAVMWLPRWVGEWHLLAVVSWVYSVLASLVIYPTPR